MARRSSAGNAFLETAPWHGPLSATGAETMFQDFQLVVRKPRKPSKSFAFAVARVNSLTRAIAAI